MINIKKASNKKEFIIIEKLAYEILHKVYDPIIPAEHTDYFLNKFQSPKAIENQIKNEGFAYYLLQYENKNTGYLGVQRLKKKLILSKLYILKSHRGLKIGKSALNFIHEFSKHHKLEKIELIVNQENKNTINIYEREGYKIIDSIINSFPNGHSVQDFKMEKTLNYN